MATFGFNRTVLRATQPKLDVSNESLFDADGIIGQFFFENEQGEAVTVNGDHYRAMLKEFLFTKIEGEPKLQSMFCALFLKIALSAAELMSFGHLGAAFWHCWTIIFWMPSKINVTSQRQLTL